MIYSPIIDQFAEVDLLRIVRPSDNQTIEGQTACWCPFCKGEKGTPHFIVYDREMGGLYGKPVKRWMCTKTKRQGYGALELWAAMRGFSLEGYALRRACISLAEHLGYTKEDIEKQWPSLVGLYDYRTVATRAVEHFSFFPKSDFTPQELTALGCKVGIRKGDITYGFDTTTPGQWHFDPVMINDEFRVYSLDMATLPAVVRNGEMQSEEIHGTPWNPLFVCFTDDTEQTGCIFRPAMDQRKNPPMVFSNSEEHTTHKVSRWLMGDRVFVSAISNRDSRNTGVVDAIEQYDPDEYYKDTKQVWDYVEDKKTGELTDKQELVDVPIKREEQKAESVIYCSNIADAIATYFHLASLRHTYPNNENLQHWYHVAFTVGDVEFSTVHHRKLGWFADSTYIFFPNDVFSEKESRGIGRRFRDVFRVALPETFRRSEHLKPVTIYGHKPASVRDFFLTYKMLTEEDYQYDHNLDKFFYRSVTTALSSCPLEKKEKRDNRSGKLKEVYYVVDPATVWEFMAGEGYFRDVDSESEDKIGRFVHLDGPFVDPLDLKSMVAATQSALADYAKQVAKDKEDYRLMLQGIARDSKEVNEKTVSSLPSMEVNYAGAYGPDHDCFYYRNGVLMITKNEIRLVPYSQVEFNIDRRAVLDFNFQMPQSLPFQIKQNPEYERRLALVDEHRNAVDENGNPQYTQQQISRERSDLMQWAQTYRWQVDWQGKGERDMWAPLRVLRGFANMDWQIEEDLSRHGEQMSTEQTAMLNGHFANLIFCLGRMLWRYRESKSNCAPYLLENTVADNRKATGGSGKSSFVKVFAGCAGKVFDVNCKDLVAGKEISFALAKFIPNVDRVVHWEDWGQGTSLKLLYNYVTSGFAMQKKFVDTDLMKLSEGPGHIISSNYPISDTDDSTLRRFCMGAFSDRFCGENIILNKPARYITDLMPDFNASGIDTLKASTRSQIAYIDALAVQFCLNVDEIISAPMAEVAHRTIVKELTDAFVRWAEYFFAQPWVYGNPIDLKSCMDEFINDFADTSDERQQKYALCKFKERVIKYCEFKQIRMNPQHLLERDKDKTQNYFHLRTWVLHRYFTEREWQNDPDVHPKTMRILERSDNVCFFFRGEDYVPASYAELKEMYQIFIAAPDPAPILDEDGTPVTLTEDEISRLTQWRNRKQGRGANAQTAPIAEATPPVTDDMPF